jgi:fructose-1,6-bisphosphatase II
VLCEKPIALDVAEATAMADRCDDAGVLLMEAFMYRHHPLWLRTYDLVAGGAIGELRAIQARFTYHNVDPDNIRNVAKARKLQPQDITVTILDRERHQEMIDRVRKMGSRVRLISDGDVAGAITAAKEGTGVDLLYGIGGTPEGVISAAALKCVGGGIQGKLWPRNEDERRELVDAGLDPGRVLTTNDLVAGDDVFVAATGVTTGSLLRGVRYLPNGALTDSIVMRSRSGTSRRIEATHLLDKLEALTGREYR